MGPKMGAKSDPKGAQKVVQKMTPKVTKKVPILGPKMGQKWKKSLRPKMPQLLGPNKDAYFEDAFKMVSKLLKIAQKRSQNDPKMVQDSPKNGPR